MLFLSSADLFSKLTFSEKNFQEYHQSILDPDCFVRPDMSPNCKIYQQTTLGDIELRPRQAKN